MSTRITPHASTPETGCFDTSGARAPSGVFQIGGFFISPGMTAGRVWIERTGCDRAGEGGDFPSKDFEALIEKFYEERF